MFSDLFLFWILCIIISEIIFLCPQDRLVVETEAGGWEQGPEFKKARKCSGVYGLKRRNQHSPDRKSTRLNSSH